MSRNILVIAAHPDDEILGCGATIRKHADAGDRIQTHILAEGITSRGEKDAAAQLEHLHNQALKANAALGVTDVTLHQLPDNRMDSLPRLEVIQRVEAILRAFPADVIYTHHAGDVNIDHRRIHEAVVTATRPMPGGLHPTVLFFEVASSTEWQPPGSAPAFTPHWYVDVSATLSHKIEALRAYAGEMRPWPHARSYEAIEYLARWRGANAGFEAAEAFMVGRIFS